jgi:tRNA uridine 5-carboxymethylaminomethyl modification enzyme
MNARRDHDVIVVGGGHAGIEAALAAARLGCRTALVSHDRGQIGRMPCNPAIGGLGKGHLVRELDVLGGEMGRAIDATGIQFRILNRRKGPAVQAPRAQADKHRYQAYMTAAVLTQPGLEVIEGDAVRLLAAPGGRIDGVGLAGGRELRSGCVILCTGTFLRGLMHVGERQTQGGREGAGSSDGLSPELRRLGFVLRRLKTGTPPRLHRDSIDHARLEMQPGDPDARPFSFRTRTFAPPSHPCWLAYTNPRTHATIRQNLSRSPLYSGSIDGRGTRYCPSIEDKIVRFADKDRHLVFLEPEGLETPEIYVNGVSTSLPADVQELVIHSIQGLEKAILIRYGYAVEYDSVPSWQVKPNLASKNIGGLYLAGQILGTSGYEEAAAQGLVAGVNAVRELAGQDPWLPTREQGYIGVLIDDLVTKEITEPYRMFTSRAEHRLHLRCDNAETRLGNAAADLGLLPDRELRFLRARAEALVEAQRVLAAWRPQGAIDGATGSAADLLRRPGIELAALAEMLPGGATVSETLQRAIATILGEEGSEVAVNGVLIETVNSIKYSGYIEKQRRQLEAQAQLDHWRIPGDFPYEAVSALSHEAREKLATMRPATVGQAGRIDGVRAGDLAILTVILKRWQADRRDQDGDRGQESA